MNRYTEKLMNIPIFEGKKAPKEIILDNGVTLEWADTAEDCNPEQGMDYDLDVYPPVKIFLRRDMFKQWHVRDAIVGIHEDAIDFWSPYVSAWLLQEMGYEENLIDAKKRVLLEDKEEGFVIPAFDKDYVTILKFIEGGN